MGFIKWNNGEPSGESEDFVEMFLNGGWERYTFNDVPGTQYRHAMCEKADPHCIKGVKCPEIENAVYNFTRPYLDQQLVRGVEVIYACKKGFVPSSENRSLTCGFDGWSQDVRCIPDCSNSRITDHELSLLNVNVSIINKLGNNSSLIIEYICNDGYDMLYEGDFVHECQGNGTWSSSDIPQCVNDCFQFNVSDSDRYLFSEASKYCGGLNGTVIQHSMKLKWARNYEESLRSAIDSRRVWTGISDVDQEDKFVFQDGEEASIKRHDEEPEDDDDLIIKWESTEPNGGALENYVLIIAKGGFYDVKQASRTRSACEIPNPHCFEGVECEKPAIEHATYNVTKRYLADRYVRGTQITYACEDMYKSTSVVNVLTCSGFEGWQPDVKCIDV